MPTCSSCNRPYIIGYKHKHHKLCVVCEAEELRRRKMKIKNNQVELSLKENLAELNQTREVKRQGKNPCKTHVENQ